MCELIIVALVALIIWRGSRPRRRVTIKRRKSTPTN